MSTDPFALDTATEKDSHEDVLKREFAVQASKGYDNQPASSGRMLGWIKQTLEAAGALDSSFRVLDVAAGTGRMSRLMAPHVREVVAIDLSEDMLAVGQQKAREEGFSNVHWIVCNAQQMPFLGGSFDVVVARLAAHHWETPQAIVDEMARACKLGGRVILIDRVAPPDISESQKARLDHLERLRDPSHVGLWRAADLHEFLRRARPPLALDEASHGRQWRMDNQVSFDQWLGVTAEGESRRAEILHALADDLNHQTTTSGVPGTGPSGVRVARDTDGQLHFTFSYAVCVAKRVEA